MTKLRECEVIQRNWEQDKNGIAAHWVNLPPKKCLFHTWGLEELEKENPISVSIAIVELENGIITTCYPWQVKFLENHENGK